MKDRKFNDFSGFDPHVWDRAIQGEKVPGPLTDLQLGSYSIQEMIGIGTYSSVYRATHALLRSQRAIKILRPDLAGDPMYVNQFRYEAAIGASLDHPYIVKVHDAGTLSSTEISGSTYHYIAMEYVEGRPLREIFTSNRPELKIVTDIIGDIGEALEYAHDRGVVHNDVKPGNILLSKDGKAKIVDFGSAFNRHWTSLNRTQGSLTQNYTAPELMKGEAPTQKSDIFAFTVVSNELLTGQVFNNVAAARDALKEKYGELLSERAINFLVRGLSLNPDDRGDIRGIRSISDWLKICIRLNKEDDRSAEYLVHSIHADLKRNGDTQDYARVLFDILKLDDLAKKSSDRGGPPFPGGLTDLPSSSRYMLVIGKIPEVWEAFDLISSNPGEYLSKGEISRLRILLGLN